MRRAARMALAFSCPATVAAARADHPHPEILGPTTYRSPSGQLELIVDPSRASGAGEARYRMTRAGRVVWERTLPYSLWEAQVADDGTVGGYAYAMGKRGSTAHEDPDALILVIFDPSGAERLVERHERRSRFAPEGLGERSKPFFSDDGRELWLFDGERTIARYALSR